MDGGDSKDSLQAKFDVRRFACFLTVDYRGSTVEDVTRAAEFIFRRARRARAGCWYEGEVACLSLCASVRGSSLAVVSEDAMLFLDRLCFFAVRR